MVSYKQKEFVGEKRLFLDKKSILGEEKISTDLEVESEQPLEDVTFSSVV